MLFVDSTFGFFCDEIGKNQVGVSQVPVNIVEEKGVDIGTNQERSMLSAIIRLDIHSLFTQKKAIDGVRAWTTFLSRYYLWE